jgi:hypothetical protein
MIRQAPFSVPVRRVWGRGPSSWLIEAGWEDICLFQRMTEPKLAARFSVMAEQFKVMYRDAKLRRASRFERLIQASRMPCGEGDNRALLLHSVETSAKH